MKHRFLVGFLLCICVSCITFAQNSVSTDAGGAKSSLFANLPAKSVCNRSELEKIAQLPKFVQVSLLISDNLVFSGEVVEKVELTDGIKNINIRLSNFGNALLNISFFNQQDNTSKIIGRITHPKNADALVIAQENGKYYITKHKMEFFMVE